MSLHFRQRAVLPCLDEIVEWGMFATTTGRTFVELRLMGDTMVPLSQAIDGGLEHDCSTWDEIYEDEENATNACRDPTKAKGTNDRTPANVLTIAQTANALEPGAEIVIRKNVKGIVK